MDKNIELELNKGVMVQKELKMTQTLAMVTQHRRHACIQRKRHHSLAWIKGWTKNTSTQAKISHAHDQGM